MTNWVSSFALAYGAVMASKGMHLAMLARIVRAPMSFFDTTPTGRIVNRFGKDIDIVDNTLPGNLSTSLNCFVTVSQAQVFKFLPMITFSRKKKRLQNYKHTSNFKFTQFSNLCVFLMYAGFSCQTRLCKPKTVIF